MCGNKREKKYYTFIYKYIYIHDDKCENEHIRIKKTK